MLTSTNIPRQQMTPDQWEATVDVAIGELRAMVSAQADLIDALMRRVVVQEATIDDVRDQLKAIVSQTVHHGQTISGLLQRVEPQSSAIAIRPASTRVRLNHTNTIKEGWRLSETTVEWSGDGLPDEGAIQHALISAANLGQREAALRNAKPAVEEGGEG